MSLPVNRTRFGWVAAFATMALLLLNPPLSVADKEEKKPSCADLQKKYTSVWEAKLESVQRTFGRPTEVRQGGYQDAFATKDLLVYDAGGRYSFLAVDGKGQVGTIPDGFHYRASELAGGPGVPQKRESLVAAGCDRNIIAASDPGIE